MYVLLYLLTYLFFSRFIFYRFLFLFHVVISLFGFHFNSFVNILISISELVFNLGLICSQLVNLRLQELLFQLVDCQDGECFHVRTAQASSEVERKRYFCEAKKALEELLIPGNEPAVSLNLDQVSEGINHGIEHLLESCIDLGLLHGTVGRVVDLYGFDHKEVQDLVHAVYETYFEVVLNPLGLFLVFQGTWQISQSHPCEERLELDVEVCDL